MLGMLGMHDIVQYQSEKVINFVKVCARHLPMSLLPTNCLCLHFEGVCSGLARHVQYEIK